MNSTFQTLKSLWQTTKRVARFTWRHLLTLCVIYLAIDFLLSVSSANYFNMLVTILIAALIDWVKMRLKFGNPNEVEHLSYISAVSTSAYTFDTNRHEVGTSAYLRNMDRY